MSAPLPFQLSPAQEIHIYHMQVTAAQQGLMYDPPSNAMYIFKNGVPVCAIPSTSLPPFPASDAIPPPGPDSERTETVMETVTEKGEASVTPDWFTSKDLSPNLSSASAFAAVPKIAAVETLSQKISKWRHSLGRRSDDALVSNDSPTGGSLRYPKQAILALFNCESVTIPAVLRDFYTPEDFEDGSIDGTKYARQPLASLLTLPEASFAIGPLNPGRNKSSGNFRGNTSIFTLERTSIIDDDNRRRRCNTRDQADNIKVADRRSVSRPFQPSPAQEMHIDHMQVTAAQQDLVRDSAFNALYSVPLCLVPSTSLSPFPANGVFLSPGPVGEMTETVTDKGEVSLTPDPFTSKYLLPNLSSASAFAAVPKIAVMEKLSQKISKRKISTDDDALVGNESQSPTGSALRYPKHAILSLFNRESVTIPAVLRDFYTREDFEAGSKDGTKYARQPLASLLTLAEASFAIGPLNPGRNKSSGNFRGNTSIFTLERTSIIDGDNRRRRYNNPDQADNIKVADRRSVSRPFQPSPAQEMHIDHMQVTAAQQDLVRDSAFNALYSVPVCLVPSMKLPPFPANGAFPPPGPFGVRTETVADKGKVSETLEAAGTELPEVPTEYYQNTLLAPINSLSEFFCVEVEPHELKRCLDYTSSECKLAAWYGDAILAKLVSDKLFKEGQGNIGSMTRRKAHYVSNTTMKEFMLGHTDARSRLTDAASMSDHSFGTVFEALLELCHRKMGGIAAINCVDKYCEWVDANTMVPSTSISISYCDFDTGYSGSTSLASVDSHSIASKAKLNTMLLEGVETWLSGTEAAKAEATRVKAAKITKSQLLRKTPNSFNSSEHIHNEMAEATWKSNKKYCYTDKYYRCCGVREGVLTCLRPLWIDATDNCHHPGDLRIPDGKGEFQYGASHFGKGKTPNWTCCNLTALAPGCVSTLSGHFECFGCDSPSDNYMKKIKQWLEKHARVLKEESDREVGDGGVVQGRRFIRMRFSEEVYEDLI